MENLIESRDLLKGRSTDSHQAEERKERLREVFSQDPATFLVFYLVFSNVVNSVSELRSLLAGDADFLSVVDSVLSRLEELEVVEVDGDKIRLLKAESLLEDTSDPETLQQYLPAIFRVAVERVLKNEIKVPKVRKARKEMTRWFVLPDSPEIALEAQRIDQEYKAKMTALAERARASQERPMGLRFVGVVDSVLEPEDFL